MKKTLVLIAAILTSAASYAQGELNFLTFNPPNLDVKVFRPDGVTGAGAGYSAQLFLSTGGGLQALTPATVFRTDFEAASFYVVDPGSVVTVPGFASGAAAPLVLRAWETAAGSYDAAVIKGQSAVADILLGGGTLPPTNPVGLQGFTMVPEPSTITLGVLGAAALLLRRRK